jgi:pimeloyl-ACP methyl ester carboxylesterase
LVCVPGGPGQAVEYLGELGWLSSGRTLILLDNRGTGASSIPADPATYRVDRLVDDIESLRQHLGFDSIDLFGHSASGGTCLLYAARHPERLTHLVLVAPSLRVVGLQSDLEVESVLAQRAHEPWHRTAVAALRAEPRTVEEREQYRRQAAPLLYGRWSPAAQAQAAAEPAQFAQAATDGFYEGFEPDPTLAERLAELPAATLLLVGEFDIWPTVAAVRQLAALFGNAELVTQPESGHFPWLDDPAAFAAAVEAFLTK